MTLEIRVASLADLDALIELDRACFSRPWTPTQWHDELAPSGALEPAVLIAHADARPIAYACAPRLAEVAELRRIGVVTEARARGVGRDLLDRVIDHAKLAGCTRIELEVAADNHAAIALYQRKGFRRVGLRPRYYLDPIADALIMDLSLARESPF
ncbi:ribosomal protein S18-alanine N-acetyltransferase [Nannocystaceae bacterium ST9]